MNKGLSQNGVSHIILSYHLQLSCPEVSMHKPGEAKQATELHIPFEPASRYSQHTTSSERFSTYILLLGLLQWQVPHFYRMKWETKRSVSYR